MSAELPRQIGRLLTLARERRLGIDLHVDETGDPASECLRVVAEEVIRHQLDLPVARGHCCSLAMQAARRQRETMARVKAARIGVIALPLCNLHLQDPPPAGRIALPALARTGPGVGPPRVEKQHPAEARGRDRAHNLSDEPMGGGHIHGKAQLGSGPTTKQSRGVTSPWNEELVVAAARDLRIALGVQLFTIHPSSLSLDFLPSRAIDRSVCARLRAVARGSQVEDFYGERPANQHGKPWRGEDVRVREARRLPRLFVGVG